MSIKLLCIICVFVCVSVCNSLNLLLHEESIIIPFSSNTLTAEVISLSRRSILTTQSTYISKMLFCFLVYLTVLHH